MFIVLVFMSCCLVVFWLFPVLFWYLFFSSYFFFGFYFLSLSSHLVDFLPCSLLEFWNTLCTIYAALSVTTLFVLLYGVCLIILFITTLKEMLLIVFVFLSFCLWACFCIGISYIFVPLISLSLPLKCNCIFSKRLLHFNYVSNIRLQYYMSHRKTFKNKMYAASSF